MTIRNGVPKINIISKLSILSLLFASSQLFAENIDIAPLINIDELEPSYDEEVTDSFQAEINNAYENKVIQSDDNEQDVSFATISLLNKITAEVKTIEIMLKQNYLYEELQIYVIDCYNSKPFEKKETAAYLNIYNRASMEKIFNGWMIKSLPSISSMEHPVYDIWVDNCNKL